MGANPGSTSDLNYRKSEAPGEVAQFFLVMLIKPRAGATHVLSKHILHDTTPAHVPVLLEGPYGRPRPLHMYETVVFITGGLGVTSVLAYLHDLAALHSDIRLILVWAARDPGLIRAVQAILPGRVDARIFCTTRKASQCYPGVRFRPNMEKVVQDEIELDNPGRIAFFVSGPPKMADEVREACAAQIGENFPGDRIGFFEDSISW